MGQNDGGIITDCTVEDDNATEIKMNVGGIAGTNFNNGTVEGSSSSAAVEGYSIFGCVVG